MRRYSGAFLAAILAAQPVSATMDSATLADLVKSRKLGLSPEETDAAMVRLRNGAVPSDLNRSRSARAVKGLAFMLAGEGRSAFDGNEAIPLQSFEASARKVEGRAVDERTGEEAQFTQEMQDFMALQEEGGKVWNTITVSGACSNEPSSAIYAFQSLVKSKVESGRARGQYADFFLYLYLLFFHSRYKEQIPLVTSGETDDPKAIATFQHTDKSGRMVFDCNKYKGLGPALQRKIVCHEFWHKFSPETGESPAYQVMSEC